MEGDNEKILEKIQEVIHTHKKCVLVTGYDLISQSQGEEEQRGLVPSHWGDILEGIIDWWSSPKNPVRVDEEKSFELEELIANQKYIDAVSKIGGYLNSPQLRRRCLNTVLQCHTLAVKEVYRLIAKLPFKAYLSMNYDTLIEAAYAAVHEKTLPKFYTSEIDDALEYKVEKKPFALKLRGDIDRPDSLCFSDIDLKQHLQDAARPLKGLPRLLSGCHVLFVGIDVNTPDLACLENLSQQNIFDRNLEHWIAVPAEKESDFRSRLSALGHTIQVIAYDSTEGVRGLLEQFLFPSEYVDPDLGKEGNQQGREESKYGQLTLIKNERSKKDSRSKSGQSKPNNFSVIQSSQQTAEREKTGIKQPVGIDLHISPDGYAVAHSHQSDHSYSIPTSEIEKIQLKLALVERDYTEERLLKDLGKHLYQAIFPDSLHTYLQQVLASDQQQKAYLRLTIKPAQWANLPWEFLYYEEGGYFLAINPTVVLSRYLDLPTLPACMREHKKLLHILFILGVSTGQNSLDSTVLENLIRRALAKPLQEQLIRISISKDATYENIKTLLAQEPDIIQFIVESSSDNSGKECLVLAGSKEGETWLVNDEHLANILHESPHPPRLVNLMTCENHQGPRQSFVAIASQIVKLGIPIVVALQYRVLAMTAEVFLENFYASVAAREPVDWAVQQTRKAIADKIGLEKRDFAAPVLYMRVKDGDIFGAKSLPPTGSNER